ncbi:hypothetical protein [Lactococcus allomyrinae]|uniref:hypothetical protein n=1 Tax=Lactococcus allomyrinae TaxID=2419773 RepID=UPI0013C42B7E|nr:hypothetical protein [Lactococcus allomyrinae]
MNKKLIIILTAGSLLMLGACTNESASNNTAARQATTHAMNFLINNDTRNIGAVTNDAPSEIISELKEDIIEEQEKILGGKDVIQTLSLNHIPATEIIKNYADKAVNALTKIQDFEITSVVTKGETKEVTLRFTPLVGIKETSSNTELLQGLKDFNPRLSSTLTTVKLQLEKDGRGIDFDDDHFRKLVNAAFI